MAKLLESLGSRSGARATGHTVEEQHQLMESTKRKFEQQGQAATQAGRQTEQARSDQPERASDAAFRGTNRYALA
jgi:hypothetical protein